MAHDDSTPIEWQAPPLATDAHFHVFGPIEQYPAGTPDLRYPMPLAPLEDYLALAGKLGIQRHVFVQPSGYGRDNSCLLDALQTVGLGAARGIVDIDESIPDAELDRLNALGVRGVRINVSPIHAPDPALAAAMLPRIERMAARCAEIGWSLDFLAPGWLTRELLQTTLRTLPVDFSIAHMGMFLAKDGVQQPGFQELLDFLRASQSGGQREGGGRCWVKLTGVYRMSTAEGFADTAPFARALAEVAPDRLIWGSDYPHLSFEHVSSIGLFNLLGQWFPDQALRRRVMVDNPARLYGFE